MILKMIKTCQAGKIFFRIQRRKLKQRMKRKEGNEGSILATWWTGKNDYLPAQLVDFILGHDDQLAGCIPGATILPVQKSSVLIY
jgi:hypothetical protein